VLLQNSHALEYEGANLTVMMKSQYLEKKKGTEP